MANVVPGQAGSGREPQRWQGCPFCHGAGRVTLSHGHPRLVVASFVITVVTFSVAGLPIAVAGAAADTVTTCSGTGPGLVAGGRRECRLRRHHFFLGVLSASSPIVLSSAVDITASLTSRDPAPTTSP